MISLKKKIFSLFLLLYFLLGSFNSLNTGLSFDENYEELNWNFHVNLVKEISSSISSEEKFDREKFNLEVKRFVGYGIGFQIISQPIQNLLKKVLIRNKDLDKYGAKLLAKHFVVFLFFFISGIFFYLILRKLIDNENFLILGTTIYLTFPYLFGQSMFSPKDVPFMSVWLVCSYFSFAIFEKIVSKENISFFVSGGFVKIQNNNCLVMVDYIKKTSDIDVKENEKKISELLLTLEKTEDQIIRDNLIMDIDLIRSENQASE